MTTRRTVVAITVGVSLALTSFPAIRCSYPVLYTYFATPRWYHGDGPNPAAAAVAHNGGFAMALSMYRVALGQYPTTAEGLNALVQPPPQHAEEWKKGGGPFIEDRGALKDPWGHNYRYACPGVHNTEGFDLWNAGPDGQDGTDDDIVN